jgi:hypothetical protein
MVSGFTMTWGPEIEGSSFLGGVEHPERMMRQERITHLEKRKPFLANILNLPPSPLTLSLSPEGTETDQPLINL